MNHFTIALGIVLAFQCAPVTAVDTKHHPEADWSSWLHIDYPADFSMDPRSMVGEAKWWARFIAPDASLTIETMSHGFCSDRLFHEDGYKTPEEYILKNVIPGSPNRTKHPGYDRLIRIDSASVTVVFLESNADWGKCYQELRFTFPDGSYETHRPVIMKVVERARPCFAITVREPNGTDQPATNPKTKGNEKAKLESEGHSR